MSRARSSSSKKAAPVAAAIVDDDLATIDSSLLDLVDHVLNKGIVLNGDLMLGVAGIDLVYLRLSAVLCAADRVLGGGKRTSADGTESSKVTPRGRRMRRSGTLTASETIAAKIGAPRFRPKRA